MTDTSGTQKAPAKKKTASSTPGQAHRPTKKQAQALARKLARAHAAHLAAQFEPEAFNRIVEEETAAAFQWMSRVRMDEVVTPEQIKGLVRRNAVEFPISGGLTETIGEMSRVVLTSSANEKTCLEDIFPRRTYDDMVDKAASLDGLRASLIHRSVHNSAYARLVADVLFTVIKGYVLSQNVVVRKVPGLGRLMDLSRDAVNMALPGVEQALESRIRDYVESHIEGVLGESERFLITFLDADRIVDIAAERWQDHAGTPLSEHFSALDPYDLDDFIVLGYEFWLHFRQTPYFEQVYCEVVDALFAKYGSMELDVLVDDVGVTPEVVTREITLAARPVLDRLLATGFLEKRLQKRLLDFYLSDTAVELLRA